MNINVFKHEESDKAGVDSTHTQGACGEELINSPVVSVSYSPTIDAEYVSVCANTVTLFNISLLNNYLMDNLRDKLNFSFIYDVKPISKLYGFLYSL